MPEQRRVAVGCIRVTKLTRRRVDKKNIREEKDTTIDVYTSRRSRQFKGLEDFFSFFFFFLICKQPKGKGLKSRIYPRNPVVNEVEKRLNF